MSTRSLFDPVIDGGIRNPNWFEGRLLTADALRDKDRADRTRERLLGRAVGAGIFEGLMVTRGSADSGGVRKTLNITKGAAINGTGDVLVLSQDVTVDVVPPTTPAQPEPKLFGRCEPPPPIASIPSGFGIYVLVMSPASGYRERAPKSGLGSEGIVTGCGDAFAVDGVRFRLEKLEPNNISGIDAAARTELTQLILSAATAAMQSRLRNLISHYCFGTRTLAGFPADPLARSQGKSDWASYGAVDDLRALKRLGCCDVPIALLLWRTVGIAFLDLWSVRRWPSAAGRSDDWPLIANDRVKADAGARWLQFQAHAAELIDNSSLPQIIKARDYFRYLPAAGLLKLNGPAGTGANATTFFQDLTVRYPRLPRFGPEDGPIFMDGARLNTLLHLSFDYPAIDLADKQAIWLYRVRENGMALDTGTDPAPSSVLVFANGEMPYAGSPRIDVARFNYANYASALLGPGGF